MLESEDASLGIVEAIVGQTRMELIFTGQANHAGTTPMHLRHDAMAAAAEWIVAVEAYASSNRRSRRNRRQGTRVARRGERHRRTVTASLDVRHADDNVRNTAVSAMLQNAKAAASRRGVQVTSQIQLEQPAVPWIHT